jgi:hypothetical protein
MSDWLHDCNATNGINGTYFPNNFEQTQVHSNYEKLRMQLVKHFHKGR